MIELPAGQLGRKLRVIGPRRRVAVLGGFIAGLSIGCLPGQRIPGICRFESCLRRCIELGGCRVRYTARAASIRAAEVNTSLRVARMTGAPGMNLIGQRDLEAGKSVVTAGRDRHYCGVAQLARARVTGAR